MTRHRTGLDTASPMPITALATKCNPVMRIAALPEVQSEKAGIWTRITRQVAFTLPAKSKSTKRLTFSNRSKVMGVQTRPLGSLIAWRLRYTHLYVTASNGAQFRTTLTRWGRQARPACKKGRCGKHDLRRQSSRRADPYSVTEYGSRAVSETCRSQRNAMMSLRARMQTKLATLGLTPLQITAVIALFFVTSIGAVGLAYLMRKWNGYD
jgi:hypothetical protein